MALALFRQGPIFPKPGQARTIIDAAGENVAITQPFQGFIPGWHLFDVLQKTHRPEALAKVGVNHGWLTERLSVLYWVYPGLNPGAFSDDLESILAHDRGYVYLARPEVKRFGLAAPTIMPSGRPPDAEDTMFTMVRVLNDIADQSGQGQFIIESFKLEKALVEAGVEIELTGVLPPPERRPRTLAMVCPDGEWTRLWGSGMADLKLGLTDISDGMSAAGRESDAERILYMNPDFIILRVGTAEVFLRDPRWQGLEAVRRRRVYSNITDLNGYTYDLDNIPGAYRWLAELVYPDLLQPRLRGILRAHYLNSYQFYLNDFYLDYLLQLDLNGGSSGYNRFERHS
ncbi:MAG: hypothetical protein LBP22_06475 [Deltaproteobacteria bacterium]|nr:hypothetical protein [Deltaproteobacteria bacterium]